MSNHKRRTLREFWDLTLQDLWLLPSDVSNGIWNDIQNAYSEPHRHYHTLKHIEDVLNLVDEISSSYQYSSCLKDNVTDCLIRLAAFFHDFEYDILNGSRSVQNSGIYAYNACLRLGLSKELSLEVQELVMITENHEFKAELQSTCIIQEILIDSDMAILGSNRESYLEYAANIRKEYLTKYTPEEFRIGRIQFLLGQIGKPIYYTDWGKTHYQETAQENMKYETYLLSDPTKDWNK